MRRLSLLLATLSLSLSMPAMASADTTLGSTTLPAGADVRECDGDVIAQVQSDPSTPYTVPTAGTITSWQINTIDATPAAVVTLVVLRNTGGTSYTVAGADTQTLPNPLPPVASYTLISPIQVSGGEILALWGASNFECFFSEGSTPLTDALISLQTPSVPSTGQSLVQDDASGGGYTLNLAANLKPAPAPAKKKCKKKKHKRSAESAKKKKCKKKKKG